MERKFNRPITASSMDDSLVAPRPAVTRDEAWQALSISGAYELTAPDALEIVRATRAAAHLMGDVEELLRTRNLQIEGSLKLQDFTNACVYIRDISRETLRSLAQDVAAAGRIQLLLSPFETAGRRLFSPLLGGEGAPMDQEWNPFVSAALFEGALQESVYYQIDYAAALDSVIKSSEDWDFELLSILKRRLSDLFDSKFLIPGDPYSGTCEEPVSIREIVERVTSPERADRFLAALSEDLVSLHPGSLLFEQLADPTNVFHRSLREKLGFSHSMIQQVLKVMIKGLSCELSTDSLDDLVRHLEERQARNMAAYCLGDGEITHIRNLFHSNSREDIGKAFSLPRLTDDSADKVLDGIKKLRGFKLLQTAYEKYREGMGSQLPHTMPEVLSAILFTGGLKDIFVDSMLLEAIRRNWSYCKKELALLGY